MEADIFLEGFLKAEETHGLRFTRIIADGDSSVYSELTEDVHIWGKNECANHTCKCMRSHLEKTSSRKASLKRQRETIRNKYCKANNSCEIRQ